MRDTQVARNKKDIENNAKMLLQMADEAAKAKRTRQFLVGIIIGLVTWNSWLYYKQHTIAVCQVKLIEHITGQEQPSVVHDLFEDDCKHAK